VKLKPTDEIRARSEDGTWVAYLFVLDCSRTWARVHVLSYHDKLGTSDMSLTKASELDVQRFVAEHKVVHRGPHKWSVVRNADKAVLQEGIAQQDDAKKWLETHARMQIGAPAEAKQAPAAATA
jgi:hypothetical protein